MEVCVTFDNSPMRILAKDPTTPVIEASDGRISTNFLKSADSEIVRWMFEIWSDMFHVKHHAADVYLLR